VDIQIGYEPPRWTGTADVWSERVRRSEVFGLDHVAVADHISFHNRFGADALMSAAVILGMSERLRINTGVYLLPLRHPVHVARQVADIAALYPDRFTFGVGIGGEDRHEVEISGIDPRTRGRRMDECITIVRALLTGESFDFDGEFFQFDDVVIGPPPSAPVPIVIGGRSDAALRRAGRVGDGWNGMWISPKRYAQAIELVEETAADAGRTIDRSHNTVTVWCGVGKDDDAARGHVAAQMWDFYQLPFDPFEKWCPAGSPEQIADFLLPYVEAGATTFNLALCGPDVATEVLAVAQIRERMLAALR
jgi:alkanesulfonate monooxygenase SsuD/methylene tetrahydromethanopterin reductase-like flavin-dependent oxidoreductase (luciferase family)